MRPTKVTYSRGLTLNVGNFESVRIDISVEAEVEPGETFQGAYQAAKKAVDAAVREEHRFVDKMREQAGA